MTRRRVLTVTAAAALAAAGVAHAQTTLLKPTSDFAVSAAVTGALPVKAWAGAARATPDLANPLDPLAPTQLVVKPLDNAVFAKTAVDHRFSDKGDVTGSLGFLCGLQPGHGDSGGAAAYGVDPHGRFVGAKLSFAFR